MATVNPMTIEELVSEDDAEYVETLPVLAVNMNVGAED